MLKPLLQRLRHLLTREFLCDTCKNDYGNVCNRRERPNAIVCPAYQRLKR